MYTYKIYPQIPVNHKALSLYSYVECSSAAIQALTAFKKLYPGHRKEEVERCIAKAAAFIESIQETDGSWLVLVILIFQTCSGTTNTFFYV